MHKNAIKKVGGVKISEISPQNEGFLDLNLWDFQHQGGTKIWDCRQSVLSQIQVKNKKVLYLKTFRRRLVH